MSFLDWGSQSSGPSMQAGQVFMPLNNNYGTVAPLQTAGNDFLGVPFPAVNDPFQAVDTPIPVDDSGGLFSMENFFGGKGQMGWGTGLFSMANAGLNTYLGMQRLEQAEKQFEFQKQAWQKNYDANRKLTNARLRDRQRARVAAAPGAHEGVDSYMKRNAI